MDSNHRGLCQPVYSRSPSATRAPFHGAARGSQTHLILITSEVHDRYARAAKSSFQLFTVRRISKQNVEFIFKRFGYSTHEVDGLDGVHCDDFISHDKFDPPS